MQPHGVWLSSCVARLIPPEQAVERVLMLTAGWICTFALVVLAEVLAAGRGREVCQPLRLGAVAREAAQHLKEEAARGRPRHIHHTRHQRTDPHLHTQSHPGPQTRRQSSHAQCAQFCLVDQVISHHSDALTPMIINTCSTALAGINLRIT